MQVIRHEAVRKYCKGLFSARSQDLRQHLIDGLSSCKHHAAAMGNERMGIAMPTDVIKRRPMRGIGVCHRTWHGIRCTVVLPPGGGSHGISVRRAALPPEGGSHGMSVRRDVLPPEGGS